MRHISIFIDSDVILDVLLNRTQFPHSHQLILKVSQKEIIAYTSPIILTNCHYLISKHRNRSQANLAMRSLRQIFQISAVNQSTVDQALASNIQDFEDALQYFSAIDQKLNYLITRNIRDYPDNPSLPILTPAEFLATHKQRSSN